MPGTLMASPSPRNPKFTRKSIWVKAAATANRLRLRILPLLSSQMRKDRMTNGISQMMYCPENTDEIRMNVSRTSMHMPPVSFPRASGVSSLRAARTANTA